LYDGQHLIGEWRIRDDRINWPEQYGPKEASFFMRNQIELRQRYGPWAVVTGASEGIGKAFAEQLAEAGVNLVVVARREQVLRELASELSRRHRIETLVVAADLGKPGGIDAVVAQAATLEVGLLVAAAGFGTSGPFVDAALETELDMIDVNCRAVAALSHHFASRFARQRRGGLVLLSSIVAFQGVPRASNYAATKAFVQALAEGLRVELAPFGVQVLASAPGPVRSGFAGRANMVMGSTVAASIVASGSLAALGRRGTTRPGLLSKLLGWSLAILPRQVRVHVMALIMGGMTKRRG
jgi:uncharacterized protein